MFREQITDVFFDLDHTLWDFEKNSALTYQKIFKENQLEVDIQQFLKLYVPINAAHWKLFREEKIGKEELRFSRLNTTFTQMNVTVADDMIYQLADDYITHLSTFNHLFDGVHEVLTYLKPNYKLHIITNGFQEVQNYKLKNSRIADYFDCVIDSEMVGVKKPNPLIFEYSLKKASVEATKSLMIGDNAEADILGAKNVGMHTIHFNSNEEDELDEGITIYKLEELKKYL
ncbi:putative hydrolase of the HAD superfamily [Pustulibacterium marinum]|uniref:Putative hydrolase of the HAD superfamily n=1 Tax=Pustulibacterium marinum TaxID=1224947 RepID=A0A1I7F604_9FLAO|nr:YjjG family noncanonical pyrimidine nucleotidase [Pustulibacterium marinum]SFU31566.1 putative hydrolase of the HAD superfamily [Pustulibacterium marinum]